MDEINQSLSIIGYNEGDKLEMRELRKVFKKKSLSMLPEKHPTVPNAYQRFEEINSSFVKGRELHYCRMLCILHFSDLSLRFKYIMGFMGLTDITEKTNYEKE